jgi:hypothetical protein
MLILSSSCLVSLRILRWALPKKTSLSQPSLLVPLDSKNYPHLFHKLLHISFGKLTGLKHLVC